MAVRTNITYSGFNNHNAQRLQDIQKAESDVSVYYNSLGGDTERTSNWNIDENGNISHCAYVRREDKLNKELRKEAEGVCYEKTISNAVVAGLEYIQGMEKKFSGTKFFVGTVSYGQTYGNSSDVNFVVNPKYLDKLGTDEETRKQFEEDVNYLNEFAKRFKQKQLSRGREIISQGWFIDENGNWGGWTISRPIKQSSVLQDMADYAEKIRQEKLEERKKAEDELKEHFGDSFKGLSIKWVEEENIFC